MFVKDEDTLATYTNKVNNEFDINNVKVGIKENTLDENGLVLIIQNDNPSGFYHYPNWELEKLIDDEWKFMVLGHQETYDENAIYINKNSMEEVKILFNKSYINDGGEKIEKLEEGKYRIKIDIINNSKYQRKEEYIEFEI